MEKASGVLSHFGTKGMKWGVRKRSASEDAARAKQFRKRAKRDTAPLSNKELQEVINRMRLEKQYAELASSEKGGFKKGHDFVNDLLKVGKTVNEASKFAQSPAGKFMGERMKRAAQDAAASASARQASRKRYSQAVAALNP